MEIELKSDIRRFIDLWSGLRTSDVRMNDRRYQVGWIVTFVEGEMLYGEFKETGRRVQKRITLVDTFGIIPDYVNLYLEDV